MAKQKNRVEKVCVICGADFEVIQSRAKSAKTCGLECRGKLIGKNYEDQRVRLNCKACGNIYSVPKCHANRRVYCSMKCADAHRNDNMPSGEKSCHWQGGTTIHSSGYLYITVTGHPYGSSDSYIFEHRIVAESRLRERSPGHPFLIEHKGVEYLRTGIVVHHIDEVKLNNDPDNLLICTAAAHRAIHNGDAPMKGHVWPEIEGLVPEAPYKRKVFCARCGEPFMAKRSDIDRGQAKYCTRDCYDKRERKSFKIEFSVVN